MTTTSFIFMLVALILLIIAIGRVQGSPKIGANLLIALAFGVVVGLGIQSKKDSCTSSKKDTKIEKVSNVNHLMPIQALPITEVTSVIVADNKPVGKANNVFTEDIEENPQLINEFISLTTRASPYYEDSS